MTTRQDDAFFSQAEWEKSIASNTRNLGKELGRVADVEQIKQMRGVAPAGSEHALTAGRLRRRFESKDYKDENLILRIKDSGGGRPWAVLRDDGLDYGTVYVHSEKQRIVVSNGTWKVMSAETDHLRDFLKSMMGGASGMKFITGNSGKYGEAARAAAKEAGEDKVVAKDMITTLEELTHALLVQAQGLNGHGNSVQMQVFFSRLRELEDEYDDVFERIGKLRAFLDLATTAVLGSADAVA